jgi:hypothetical protein
LDFSNDGDTAGPVLTPSIVGVEAMPFVNNIKVFGEGTTPTVTWEVPQDEIAARGLNIDWFSIVIRDKDVRRARPDGSTFADVIWQSNAISPNILGGQIPDGILEIGGDYVIEISMQDSRSNCFACFEDIQSNSLTFFDFTPLTSDPSGGAGVVLPTVGPDGIYRFTAEVSLGEALFIDPLVAIGYDYAIGVGDPNFASVLLPFVGDDLYELWLWDGFDYVLADLLDAGVEYFFGTGGVDRFRILGIETAAMLDPNNATAFVTGLTFTDDGLFTGTMTPITTFVPLPATLGLLLLGGLAMRRFA